MKSGENFFDFAAYVGFTKHLGGLEATKKMAKSCHIQEESYVLDVGCGAGVSACFLAKNYGCRVVGVDIYEGMIDRSNERAIREGVRDLVEFKVADAQNLPFENDLFDAVITESVTAFPRDKQRAVKEYARVTKPGGYVGLNESTWIKYPPPPEVLAWISRDLGDNATPLTCEAWVRLLENAGFTKISATIHEINIKDETRGILQRYGFFGMLRIMTRMAILYLNNPAYRKFIKAVRQQGVTPDNLDRYFGYGFYVGLMPYA